MSYVPRLSQQTAPVHASRSCNSWLNLLDRCRSCLELASALPRLPRHSRPWWRVAVSWQAIASQKRAVHVNRAGCDYDDNMILHILTAERSEPSKSFLTATASFYVCRFGSRPGIPRRFACLTRREFVQSIFKCTLKCFVPVRVPANRSCSRSTGRPAQSGTLPWPCFAHSCCRSLTRKT